MRKLKPYWQDRRPEEIDVDSWAEFANYFEEKYPGETFFNTRKYMRAFCEWLFDRKFMAAVPKLKNPFAAQERRARKRKKSRVLTLDEIDAIYSACGERERLLVLLMFTMAFRVNEACALKWENLDLDSGTYSFGEDDNKAGLEGAQSLSDSAWTALKAMKASGPYVFPQQSDIRKPIRPQMIDWKAIKSASGVNWPWTPHTFRHTCLTFLFGNAAYSHAAIMKCYRISYKVALEHYIHIDEVARNTLRNAVTVRGASK
jgi:integrase